jgi:molybdate transport system regulatory protein
VFNQDKLERKAKVWLEYKAKPLLGNGGATILEAIKKEGSITEAAKTAGMSYRYVWNYLNRMNRVMGEPVIETFKGGKFGGGGARLTVSGEILLKEHMRLKDYVNKTLSDEEYWEAARLKISARNMLKGVVKSVEKGDIVSKVKMDITLPVTVTALISTEAVEDLDLKSGDKVEAVIKATEVMVAKEK